MNNSAAVHRTQTDCPSGVPITFTVVLSTISLLAVTGNLLVIITFIKTANLRTSPNYYIVNMAVSDLVCVILNWPLYATEGMLKPGGSLIRESVIASIFCKIGIYSRAVSYAVSILSLVLIAVDRFIATVYPLKASNITGKIRAILLILCWILPTLGLVQFFAHSEIIKVEDNTFCRNMMRPLELKIYHFLSFALFYCLPLSIIVVLYSLIMKHLQRKGQLDEGKQSTFRTKRLKQIKNIMKIFGSIVLGFFTCWTPLYVYMFLKSLYPSIFMADKCLLLKLVGIFYYIFPLLSTVINPLILITFSSNYRAALKGLCSCLVLKNHSGPFVHAPRVVAQQGQTSELLEFNTLRSRITHN